MTDSECPLFFLRPTGIFKNEMPNPQSLRQNGKRASEPQPLPELLKDKAHL